MDGSDRACYISSKLLVPCARHASDKNVATVGHLSVPVPEQSSVQPVAAAIPVQVAALWKLPGEPAAPVCWVAMTHLPGQCHPPSYPLATP